MPAQLKLPGFSDVTGEFIGPLSDTDLLAILIGGSKSIAATLLREFGSLGEAIAAPIGRLTEAGLDHSAASRLKAVHASIVRVLRGEIGKRPVLSSWSTVLDYLRASMAFGDREQFRILFLDRRNALIADEVQGAGTVDHCPVYPREVMRRALEHRATALILVHNHPSGDPTPSRADIEMTKALVDAGAVLGIAIHDHIIVGKQGHASLKALRHM